ncbi:MAG: phage terminase large subunit family protein [Hydrogenophaga sp.]|nr:phage terminase large subunit family protein [Hydrogenophaga sp.]
MYASGAASYVGSFRAGLMPDPEMWVDEWCESHAYIPSEGNAEGGKYNIDRTPFAREVMHVLSPGHPTNRVVVMGASQLLKTQTAMNWLMAIVDAAPANILALMPSGDLASRLSSRINKTLKATPRVTDLFAKPRTRDGKNTDSTKEFRGGTLHIATAGSAANLAEIPARYGYGDEIDDWESDLQGQGDPVEIFENRGSTYGRNRKWYYSSSPKRPRGISKILELFEKGDQRYYHVPCPDCGEYHALDFDNLRTDEQLTWARMMCPACGVLIDEYSKTEMLARGRWVPTSSSKDGTVSYTISQLYAPMGWTSWLELARLHDAAEEALRIGDPTKMQAFYNTRLALPYDNTKGVTTVQALMDRAEEYPPRTLPDAALVVTMAVDTQPDRLEVQIDAWGPGMERWVMDYIVLAGNPSTPPEVPGSVWARLDEIRNTPYQHASGVLIPISAYGVDSGGANTQDVYHYGARRRASGSVILKGASRPNRPIISAKPSQVEVDWGGAKDPHGAELWLVGTDVAKDWIFNRIELPAGPGALHFHKHIEHTWFEQLLAERKVQKLRGGSVVEVWHKEPHARNEALDLCVYSLAIAFKLRLDRWSALDWSRLRAKLIPKQITTDLFSAPTAEAQTPDRAEPLPEGAQAEPFAPVPVAAPVSPAPHVPAAFVQPVSRRRIINRGIQ